jgi:hypothetical protein
VEESTRFLARPEEFFNALPQCGIMAASFVQVRRAFARGQLPSRTEDSQLAFSGFRHRQIVSSTT